MVRLATRIKFITTKIKPDYTKIWAHVLSRYFEIEDDNGDDEDSMKDDEQEDGMVKAWIKECKG